MADEQESGHSIQQRIYAILSDGQERKNFVPPPAPPEEVEELEYRLARAEIELREAQARVDQLRLELEAKRGPRSASF